MEQINSFIRLCWDKGYSNTIYYGAVVVTVIMQVIFLLYYRKNYGISAKNTVILVLTVFPIAYFWVCVVTWIANGFTNFGANNIVRLYVWMPLIVLLVCHYMKLNAGTVCEFIAPSMALEHAVAHIVCPFSGCCYGYPCSWGVYNPVYQERLFPVQWLECIVSFVIFLIIKDYARKTGYKKNGKAYPMFLVLYGSTRFFLEFLRDNDKIVLGISNLALNALLMTAVGAVWIMFLNERGRKAELDAAFKKRKTKH